MRRSWFGLVIVLFVAQIYVNMAWVQRAGGPWFSPPPSEPLPPLGYTVALSPSAAPVPEATSLLMKRLGLNPEAPGGEVRSRILYSTFYNDHFAENRLGTMGYQVASSIYYPLVAAPALLLGRSELTMRLGPMAVLALAALAAWLITSHLDTPRTGAAAACLVLLCPAMFGLSRSSLPMYGVVAWSGLAAYCWMRSEGFLRLPWCVAGALMTVFTLRGGESLGDGLQGLISISGVMVLTFWAGLLGLIRREWRRMPGIMAGGLILAVLVDWDWLVRWLGIYVLPQSEASSIRGHHGEAPFVWWAYLYVLRHSTLGLVGLGLLVIALPFTFRKDPQRPLRLALVASALVTLVALTLTHKRQNFYLVPVMPVLSVITALGLARVPRLGTHLPLVGVISLLPTWLYLSYVDRLPQVATGPVWIRAAVGDSLLGGSRSGLRARTLPGEVFERPIVELPATGLEAADDFARWARTQEAGQLWACVPVSTQLVLLVPDGLVGQLAAMDVRYSVSVRRPDIPLVVVTPHHLADIPKITPGTIPILLVNVTGGPLTPTGAQAADALQYVMEFTHSATSGVYVIGHDLEGLCPDNRPVSPPS